MLCGPETRSRCHFLQFIDGPDVKKAFPGFRKTPFGIDLPPGSIGESAPTGGPDDLLCPIRTDSQRPFGSDHLGAPHGKIIDQKRTSDRKHAESTLKYLLESRFILDQIERVAETEHTVEGTLFEP